MMTQNQPDRSKTPVGNPSVHDHVFMSENQRSNEQKTWAVIVLTALTMGLEIVCGMMFGSMALLADGWHMASHASALGITAFAYAMARKHKNNRKFTFGTGKIGDLAGYSSALFLLVIAVTMVWESVQRFIHPVPIRFTEAMIVAVIGLAVNLVSALILKDNHHHPHDDDETHGHAHDHDHNIRAAYVHVLADALTSILAIMALGLGMFFGWSFLDPAMGIAGALLITQWALKLMAQSGAVLLDHSPDNPVLLAISEKVSQMSNLRVVDLHVWRVGPGHYSAILSVRSTGDTTTEDIRARLADVKGLSHLTVEINRL